MYTKSIIVSDGDKLINATSVVLGDFTGTYGIKKTSDDTVVVANNTSTTNSSTGMYEYNVSSLELDVEYEISWKITYSGLTQYKTEIFTLVGLSVEVKPFGYDSFTLSTAIQKTREMLNDFEENVWTNTSIISFINSGILIIKSKIPEYFTDLKKVSNNNDIIDIDLEYSELIALFAASRCFEVDEQEYQAIQKRNEFEARLESMESEILKSKKYEDKLLEDDTLNNFTDYVRNVYFDYDIYDEVE